jgi:hypothetical protein
MRGNGFWQWSRSFVRGFRGGATASNNALAERESDNPVVMSGVRLHNPRCGGITSAVTALDAIVVRASSAQPHSPSSLVAWR